MNTFIPAWVDGELKPVEKLKVHQLGLRHKAVSVFVLHGSKLLLQKRAACKYHTPGLWANTCCTHPDWNEVAVDCAARRLREELGITGLSPRFSTVLEYRADVGQGLIEHELVDVFRADTTVEMTLLPNPDEVSDTRWVHLAELNAEIEQAPERFTPWLRIYMRDHAQRILGPALAADLMV
ncbi:isopentenyl-diphosphate Delta-isomerase [Ruegeria profundi]|uniref:isopentenyl-diphosphate Delta-isomerase n=1 Tax=Ruegeria profundi TaxID=1685378 RepID=UPI003C7A09B4